MASKVFTRDQLPKFCANLSFMFPNMPFQDRYVAAKKCGFIGVESAFPSPECCIEELQTVIKSLDMKHVMMNSYAGDPTKGENGFAALPDKKKEFEASIIRTVEFAKALGIIKIHIIAGVVKAPTEANDIAYEQSLLYAEKLLRENDIVGLIEPINSYSLPGYYLNSYDRALDIIKKIDSPHLKLMLDIFHLQHIQGNIFRTLSHLMPHVGHIQIAQVPDRNEPDSNGELNYKFILDTIVGKGYNDWIGLEYKPKGTAHEGMSWIKDYGYSL